MTNENPVIGFLVNLETFEIELAYALGDHSPEEVHTTRESAEKTLAWAVECRLDEMGAHR